MRGRLSRPDKKGCWWVKSHNIFHHVGTTFIMRTKSLLYLNKFLFILKGKCKSLLNEDFLVNSGRSKTKFFQNLCLRITQKQNIDSLLTYKNCTATYIGPTGCNILE